MAVITVPVAWFAAGWIVQAVLFTLAGRWDVDGRAYLAADYYRRLLTSYLPWLFGGAATLALAVTSARAVGEMTQRAISTHDGQPCAM